MAETAIDLFRNVGVPDDPDLLRPLIDAASGAGRAPRALGLRLLGSFGEKGLPVLLEAARHADANVRRGALSGLARAAEADDGPTARAAMLAIVSAFRDPDLSVVQFVNQLLPRLAAKASLVRDELLASLRLPLVPENAVELVGHLLQDDPDLEARVLEASRTAPAPLALRGTVGVLAYAGSTTASAERIREVLRERTLGGDEREVKAALAFLEKRLALPGGTDADPVGRMDFLLQSRTGSATLAPASNLLKRELITLARRHDSVVAALADRVRRGDPAFRENHLGLLSLVATEIDPGKTEPIVKTLAELAALPDQRLASRARQELVRVGEPAVPAIVAFAQDSAPLVREWVPVALEDILRKRINSGTLAKLLNDPSEPVADVAAKALQRLGGAAVPAAAAALTDPRSTDRTRRNVLRALHESLWGNHNVLRPDGIEALSPLLAGYVGDPDVYAGRGATELLVLVGGPAVPHLAKRFDGIEIEKDDAVGPDAAGRNAARREALVETLLRIETPEAMAAAEKAAASDGVVRYLVVQHRVHRSGDPVNALLKVLDDPEQRIRAWAALRLWDIGQSGMAALLTALEGPSPDARTAALDVLSEKKLRTDHVVLYPRIREAVVRAVTADAEPRVRRRAVVTLGATGWPDTLPIILAATKDADPTVRSEAVITAWRKAPSDPGVTAAWTGAFKDPDERVRRAAIGFVLPDRRTTKRTPEERRAILEASLASLHDPSPAVRRAGLEVAADVRDDAQVREKWMPVIRQLAERDPDRQTRAAAAAVNPGRPSTSSDRTSGSATPASKP